LSDASKSGRPSRARTQEGIFTAMHRELRAWNPEIPESPDRLDPILRLLLQLYAGQLARIDSRVDKVWEVATNALIRSVCPESMRWPVPAFTVMRCEPNDPIVDIDTHVKFFYRETREGGQTFFFSPLRHERLVAARVRYVFLRADDTITDLSPQTGDGLSMTSRPRVAAKSGAKYQIYMGIDYDGQPSDLTGAAVFLKGIPDTLKQLRWATWYPGSNFGGFYEDSGFCPGLTEPLDTMFAGSGGGTDWGGLRTSSELFKPLEDSFVTLPEKFTSTWELGPPDRNVVSLMKGIGEKPPDESERLYWIRLDLPPGGDKSRLYSSFEAYFNCFIAVNKNDLTLFKHTGGNRLVEVELPENLSHVLEISGVIDSAGRDYVPRHEIGAGTSQRFYSSEERGNRLVLWFDFSSALEMPPDSLTVNYAVTAGTDANGIEAGKIKDLYESHPGISSAVNIIPTAGAIPAKTEKQIVTEVAARLRNRDRSLSFPEISRWAKTFDPRIKNVTSENGVERFERGVRRCIVVKVGVGKAEFYSDDEISLLRTRLGNFLKARSPVNTHFRVEIASA
jgi:hypothetical protein